MKYLKSVLYLMLIGFVAYSCSREEVKYEGESFLHFVTAGSDQMVELGSGGKEVEIEYGTVSKVSGASEVKLIVDESSEAKEGVDFEIVKGTDNPSGKFEGFFKVNFLESAATTDVKKAVFKIASSNIKNGVLEFQTHTINVSLKCPSGEMNGTFDNEGWLNGTGENEIVVDEANKKLIIKSFMAGKDFEISFNPDTYVASFEDQSTGFYSTANGGYIWLRPTPGEVSSFNPCTRVLTIKAFYYIPGVGNYGGKTETFTGK